MSRAPEAGRCAHLSVACARALSPERIRSPRESKSGPEEEEEGEEEEDGKCLSLESKGAQEESKSRRQTDSAWAGRRERRERKKQKRKNRQSVAREAEANMNYHGYSLQP